MEIQHSDRTSVELSFDGKLIRLVQHNNIFNNSPLLLRADSLEEIDELMQRVEFFYFTHSPLKPAIIFEDLLTDEQLVRFFDPEGRAWEVFFLS
jgi:hypothetical protein